MDMYQNGAEDLLRELAHLKSKERNLLADIKAVQTLLTHHVENGDLDHLKTDAESTYRFEDTNFVYSPGRITWKYDDCNDVIAARENLKELEDTARAVGTAQRKQGTPFWSSPRMTNRIDQGCKNLLVSGMNKLTTPQKLANLESVVSYPP
jgi:hypothetical protein